MALSELPPPIDDTGDAGAEPPLVRVPPPGSMSKAWLARLQGVDAPWTAARRERRAAISGLDESPIVLVSAKGSNIADLDGNRYVDFVAAFGAALLGHGATRVARTLEMQSERLVFGLGDVYPSDSKIALTERLARLFPEAGARVMLGLSGSDAMDAAMKTSLLATGRPGIVAFEGGYHGLATGPLAMNGLRAEYRAPFAPHLSPHVRFAPFARRESELDAALSAVDALAKSGEIGAIVVEPILGRGGVHIPPAGFLGGLREIATRTGALLVADEIWTGLGRSGAILRSVEDGVIPDLVCLGKGLGGGMPISACVGKGEVMEAWRNPKGVSPELAEAGLHGEAIHTATHFGNPLACACAIAVLDSIFGQKLHVRAKDEGEVFLGMLREACGPETKVREIRGKGLMLGIEVEGGPARGLGLVRDLMMTGWLVLTGGAGDVITLTPPLNMPRKLMEAFTERFAQLAAMRAL
ncbi:MAG: aspartate aminotransferase family protein [Deltaproteobacteria bacterium]|nr:aspartate aminotransferase family protein [Deltaproteobacteria bacterium]